MGQTQALLDFHVDFRITNRCLCTKFKESSYVALASTPYTAYLFFQAMFVFSIVYYEDIDIESE